MKFRQNLETISLLVPGPGVYNPVVLDKKHPVSIGTSKRSKLGAAIGSEYEPGPGTY